MDIRGSFSSPPIPLAQAALTTGERPGSSIYIVSLCFFLAGKDGGELPVNIDDLLSRLSVIQAALSGSHFPFEFD